jgi:predicted AAA+ superfamily ATPase
VKKSVVKEEQIKVIYKALNQLPAFEKCILIMCGDIAFGGKKEEYRKAKIFIEEMSSGINRLSI